MLALLFERYNHLLYLPFRRPAVEKLLLLRPTKEFYFLLYAKNLAVVWILAVFIAGLHYARGSSMSLSNAFAFSFLVAVLGSAVVVPTTRLLFSHYLAKIREAAAEVAETPDPANEISSIHESEGAIEIQVHSGRDEAHSGTLGARLGHEDYIGVTRPAVTAPANVRARGFPV